MNWRDKFQSLADLTEDEIESRYVNRLIAHGKEQADKWKKQQQAMTIWCGTETFDDMLEVTRRYITGELNWAPNSQAGNIPLKHESLRLSLLKLNTIGFLTYNGQIGYREFRRESTLFESRHHVAFDVKRNSKSLRFIYCLMDSDFAVSAYDQVKDKHFTNVPDLYPINRRREVNG